jgi:hypothetical protein
MIDDWVPFFYRWYGKNMPEENMPNIFFWNWFSLLYILHTTQNLIFVYNVNIGTGSINLYNVAEFCASHPPRLRKIQDTVGKEAEDIFQNLLMIKVIV